FLGRIAGAIAMPAQVGICGGVPEAVVDAVRSGQEVGLAGAQQRVQPAAELRRKYLARIVAADSRDAVGVAQAGFQEAELVVEARPVVGAISLRNSQLAGAGQRENALERQ